MRENPHSGITHGQSVAPTLERWQHLGRCNWCCTGPMAISVNMLQLDVTNAPRSSPLPLILPLPRVTATTTKKTNFVHCMHTVCTCSTQPNPPTLYNRARENPGL